MRNRNSILCQARQVQKVIDKAYQVQNMLIQIIVELRGHYNKTKTPELELILDELHDVLYEVTGLEP
jgi:phosphoglycerate-specific signal transduction histidine kinase